MAGGACVNCGQVISFISAFFSLLSVVIESSGNQWNKINGTPPSTWLVYMWGINPYMVTIRAFMWASVLACFVGCVTLLFGMHCTKIMEVIPLVKRRLVLVAGVLFTVSGILVLSSTIWIIILLKNDELLAGNIGASIYAGISTICLNLITSVLCFCLPAPGAKKNDYLSKIKLEYNTEEYV